jgi:hypothetical protein
VREDRYGSLGRTGGRRPSQDHQEPRALAITVHRPGVEQNESALWQRQSALGQMEDAPWQIDVATRQIDVATGGIELWLRLNGAEAQAVLQ